MNALAQRRTPTPSPATTCRRPTSGRRWSSPPRTCSTPSASTPPTSSSTCRSRPSAPTGRRCARRTASVWTYGELQRRANQVAQVLVEDLGLVPGNRVLLRSPNNPWTVAAWLGVLKAGGVVGHHVRRAARPGARPDRGEDRADDRPGRPPVRRPTSRRCATRRPGPGDRLLRRRRRGDLVARAASKSGEFTAVETAADDVALLRPDLRQHRGPEDHHPLPPRHPVDRQHLRRSTCCGLHARRPGRRARAPFAFTFGLGMLVVFPLRAGACALLTESATPAQLADLVAEHGVTVLATAPTAYKQILAAGRVQQLARPARRGQRRRAHPGADLASGSTTRSG